MLQKSLEKVASLHNKAHLLVAECLLFRHARDVDTRPGRDQLLSDKVEFVVASTALKSAKPIFAVDFVRHITAVHQRWILHIEELPFLLFFLWLDFVTAPVMWYSPVFHLLE